MIDGMSNTKRTFSEEELDFNHVSLVFSEGQLTQNECPKTVFSDIFPEAMDFQQRRYRVPAVVQQLRDCWNRLIYTVWRYFEY